MKNAFSSPHPSPSARQLEQADRIGPRLWGGLAVSVGVNLLLWATVGKAILSQKTTPPPIIEVSRVILTPQGKKIEKVVSKQQVERKVRRIRHQIERKQPPKVRPQDEPERAQPRLKPQQAPRPNAPQAPEAPQNPKAAPPPAPGAHNRTLTAQNPTAPDAGQVKAGGNASQGKPLDAQNYGNATHNPNNYTPPPAAPQPTEIPAPADTPIPPAPEPTNTPRPEPTNTPKPEPTNTPKPEPTSTPKPEPTNTPRPDPTSTPKPEPTNTPRPKGPTREAVATRQVQPDIPDELRDQSFKSSVRVRVEIAADGASTVTLRSSSGNATVDSRALAALQRWRWKPALKDGVPVASIQNFRFDFEVR